jgi:hypothetical protein
MAEATDVAIGGAIALMFIAMMTQMVQASTGGNGGVVPPQPSFDMEITSIDEGVSKFASAFWNMQVNCKITNNNASEVTRSLAVIWQRADSPDTWYSSRYWSNSYPDIYTPVTLQAGESVNIVSPFYYIDGYHEGHGSYEWDNFPPGQYHAGVKIKYNFKIVDDQGNESAIMSAGSYMST